MKTTRSDIDILADKLRKCYQFERKQLARHFSKPADYRVPKCWQGGGREKKGHSIFHKLALFCQRQEIDPIHYIQWCLAPSQVLLGPAPEPNQLLTPKMMTAYQESLPKLQRLCCDRIKREMDLAESQHYMNRRICNSEEAWTVILLSDHLELSPLFRYFIAWTLALGPSEERFLKIAQDWENRALLQYQRYPDVYSRCKIIKLLPPDFSKRAARFYDQLLEEEP